MPPETVFSLSGTVALCGWAVLVLGAFVDRARPLALTVAGLLLPLVLAAVYVALLVVGREAFSEGGFGSIAAVRALFGNDAMLTAGWVHYLAFDLFVGAFILRDGRERGLAPWLLVPCYVPTFLFGPVGLLCYVALRSVPSKREAL